MTWKEKLIGEDKDSDYPGKKLGLPPYRRWYGYGRRSPGILFARLRNKYQPIRRTRFAWQRARRGYDDPMLWNLNHAVASLVLAGVREMREQAHSYPPTFCEPEEVWFDGAEGGGWEAWEAILVKIEEGFQAYLDDDWFDFPEKEAKYEEGMALFAKYFRDLWD